MAHLWVFLIHLDKNGLILHKEISKMRLWHSQNPWQIIIASSCLYCGVMLNPFAGSSSIKQHHCTSTSKQRLKAAALSALLPDDDTLIECSNNNKLWPVPLTHINLLSYKKLEGVNSFSLKLEQWSSSVWVSEFGKWSLTCGCSVFSHLRDKVQHQH